MIKRLIKFYTLQSTSERSELCDRQSKLLYNGVLNSELWAQQLIDASAKLPNGITKLHLSDVGYFDECIQIKNESIPIMGKYCLANFRKFKEIFIDGDINDEIFSNYFKFVMVQNLTIQVHNSLSEVITPSWAICVPDGCTAKEVQNHLNTFAGVDIFKIGELNCQTNDTYISKLNIGDWIVIGFIICLCLVVILSTTYDVYLYYNETASSNMIFIAFSWFTNFRKLIKINDNPDTLHCLNGIRFLSMLWIVLGHEYSMIIFRSTTLCINLLDVKDWYSKFSSMIIIGSTVSVDTFLLISGCLLMYGYLNSQIKNMPFNIFLFYLHRYLRLTPSYIAVIIFLVTLFRFMGSGPLWDSENTNEPCKTNWWAALLYIQNYVTTFNRCVGQSWYLQIDMQLYVLSPLLLIPIGKWSKVAPYILITLIFIFILIPGGVAWHYKLAAFMDLRGDEIGNVDLLRVYYLQTYTRAGPWVLGLLLGYILFNVKNKDINLNKFLVILFWIISITLLMYTIFGFYPETKPDYKYNRVFNSLFIGLHRVIWSAGLSWIIFACVNGYGGPVNWILSLSVFQVLARLTYSMYLIHVFLQNIHHSSLKVAFEFSNKYAWNSFCGTLINLMVISLLWTLTFESPFVIIDAQLKNFQLFIKKNTSIKRSIITENVSNEHKL